ncbi:MAG: HAD hydrolase-like protein [Pseudomonadota bacterium]|nr:HAD hydrolase-like protein [Pseudomonadota bacterium]
MATEVIAPGLGAATRSRESTPPGHAVFDLDGTLIDSVPLCTEILNSMLADRGAPFRLSQAQTRPHVTAGGTAMVAALLGGYCGDPSRAIAEFRERYASLPTLASSLYPAVRQGLAELQSLGIGLAMWSNKPQLLCEKVVDDLGLADCFTAVVGTGLGIPLKPDPFGLRRALALAGGTRARSCYIGDSELDGEAARRARVPFIRVTYGYGGPAGPRGERAVDDFAAVPAAVADLLASLARSQPKPARDRR